MRSFGILMPIFSLPSHYGVGDFGEKAYEFVDYLESVGANIWQILPLNPCGFGNSPYQPYSSFAGEELYIDLIQLKKQGLIKELKEFNSNSKRVDYKAVREYKRAYLKEAFINYRNELEYDEDTYNYAVFMALRKHNNGKCWNEWDSYDDSIIKMLEKDIKYEIFLQVIFHRQWLALKEYANSKGIRIMGDIPFYVGLDSMDVWKNQEEFLLDERGRPTHVAGVPPDYFSKYGQRWGNPIYNFEKMKKNGYKLWIKRIEYASKIYDILRLDHFRAFDTYWKIPSSCTTAVEGEWVLGPGSDFFDTLNKSNIKIELVAEDLGELRKEVYELRDKYSLPGMNIFEFTYKAFSSNEMMNENNMVVYTGTHDNDTFMSWYSELNPIEKKSMSYDLYSYGYGKDINKAVLSYILNSACKYAIIPVQDLLGLDGYYRINTPSTLGSPNWEFRLVSFDALYDLKEYLKKLVRESGRYEGGSYRMKEMKPRLLLDRILDEEYGKTVDKASKEELFRALFIMVNELSKGAVSPKGNRKLYYISAEFLIGRLLSNNMINLGVYDDIRDYLEEKGIDFTAIEEEEKEPSLGNGGLGRLAACFLDSVASLGLNGDGIGINYHLGLFKQVFEKNKQMELPNSWIDNNTWLKKRDRCYEISFKDFTLKALLYDIDVIGYGGKINKLHLFDVADVDESIVKDGIDFDKEDIKHNLSLFLYPDDSDESGRKLRIYQQYFMVSCAARYIIDELKEAGHSLDKLNEHVVIQINDTHPSMIIPELIRLMTIEGIYIDDAIEIVRKTCAYTNHTILSEALEKWPLKYLQEVVPELVPIIHYLDLKIKKYDSDSTNIVDKNNMVHMAHMDIHYGFSINGVAQLHTEILKNSELNSFYKLYPDRFNNKTNGITFRRWLLHTNRKLTDYLTKIIGSGFKDDYRKLKDLLQYKDDENVLKELLRIKDENKKDLSKYLSDFGIDIDENSIYDIQIKRLHEYKRQQMNALYAIYKYKEIKKGKLPKRPLTMIFGAKAAPAYVIAKDIIHLILCLQEIINNDPDVNKYLRVVMVENYNVSLAEKLIPACDISEQISLASKEASGTGNMKLMLNGAITLGTDDGANVEIHDLVGDENIAIFGKKSDDVIKLYNDESYSSKEIYDKDPLVKELVDFLMSKEIESVGDKKSIDRLYKDIITKDYFMALLDLREYIDVKENLLDRYEDRIGFAKTMLVNIANAYYFSSDRTIEEYNKDIWKL